MSWHHPFWRRGCDLFLTLVGLCVFSTAPSVVAQPLDPLDFSSLGTLDLSGGSFTFDTDALTIVNNAAPGTPLYTGIADDQNGTADFINNVWVPGSDGIPEISVFTFDDVNLQSTATINVVGTRALALLSHGNVMIDTTIDLSGEDVEGVFDSSEVTPVPAGVGRAGGFSGTFTEYADPFNPTVPGDGPGGGGGAILFQGGAGGFGGPGKGGPATGAPGAVYGDLVAGPLQGGSGGGSNAFSKGGAAGGGALEIAAVGTVTLAAGGNLIAAGGDVEESFVGSFEVGGGVGSGGGIRIGGQAVDLLGSVDVSASAVFSTSDALGGGGRVAIFGSNQLFEFIVGVTNPSSIDTSTINVEGGVSNPFTRGLISIVPLVTSIPTGQSLTLGAITDLSDSNRRLELVHRNVRVQHGGQAVVPVAGYANTARIELFPGDARVTGSGTLDNRGELGGWGTVEVPVINHIGGTIDAVNDLLTFTASVTNGAGGQINAINSTLSFPGDGVPSSSGGDNSDGLTNNGDLTLINAVVNGDVHSPAGSQINVAGDVVFNGLVSGGADFSGTSNSVTFNGGFAPGDSPAEVAFGGDVTLSDANTLFVELEGTTPGSEFDRLVIAGIATLDGTLDVVIDETFDPSPGDTFEVMTFGSRSGTFAQHNGLGLVDDAFLVPQYTDTSLTIIAAIPGDASLDGQVDIGDFTVWGDGFGTGTAFAQGDFSGDGVVDIGDFTIWGDHFGELVSSPGGSLAAVPEPSTCVLFLIGAVGLIFPAERRARRTRNREKTRRNAN